MILSSLFSMLAEAIPTSEGPTWAFWVTVVAVPLFFVAIGSIIWRLRRGEEKFDAQGIAIATLSAKVEGLQDTQSRLTTAISSLVDRMNDRSIESAGDMGELRAGIAREFVSKEDFDRERARTDERFAELGNTIRQISREETR